MRSWKWNDWLLWRDGGWDGLGLHLDVSFVVIVLFEVVFCLPNCSEAIFADFAGLAGQHWVDSLL